MNLSPLYSSYFTINDLYVEHQHGVNNARYSAPCPRPTDAFMLFTGATAICRQEGKEPLFVPYGSLVYIPRGSQYSWEHHTVGDIQILDVILFEFTLKKHAVSYGKEGRSLCVVDEDEIVSFGTESVCIVDQNFTPYNRLFRSLLNAYTSPRSTPLSIYHSAYAIFEYLLKSKQNVGENLEEENLVNTAMRYLMEPEISVEEVAARCCVSWSGLEKKFRKVTGISPREYLLNYKISTVKNMLVSTDKTLFEIAELVGFYDSGYLCKLFKARVGKTPMQYRNEELKK